MSFRTFQKLFCDEPLCEVHFTINDTHVTRTRDAAKKVGWSFILFSVHIRGSKNQDFCPIHGPTPTAHDRRMCSMDADTECDSPSICNPLKRCRHSREPAPVPPEEPPRYTWSHDSPNCDNNCDCQERAEARARNVKS